MRDRTIVEAGDAVERITTNVWSAVYCIVALAVVRSFTLACASMKDDIESR